MADSNGQNGPNVGLLISCFIGVCVVLGVFWQAAFGSSSGEEEDEARETPVQGQAGGGEPASTQDSAEQNSPEATQETEPESTENPPEAMEETEPEPATEGGSETTEGGAEAGNHDPLGTGAEPGELSETEREEVEAVATEYVPAVYDYAGLSALEYRTNVREVAAPEYYEGPGGDTVIANIEDVEERAEKEADGPPYPTHTNTEVEEWRITGEDLTRVEGEIYYNAKADDLRTADYREKLELENREGEWEVVQGGEREELNRSELDEVREQRAERERTELMEEERQAQE